MLANLGDLSRPVDQVSISQSASLATTGIIWSRYSLVVIPKNWNLFSVNVFVGLSGVYQVTRAWRYQRSLKNAKT